MNVMSLESPMMIVAAYFLRGVGASEKCDGQWIFNIFLFIASIKNEILYIVFHIYNPN